jgi:DNA invertase Pin-like site-specific DNA recombinase
MTETSAPLRLVGEARLSTKGRTLEAQLEQLAAARCGVTYHETASGANGDHKHLRKMLAELQRGDLELVARINRLALSIFDLFTIVKCIADAVAQFRSLPEPLVNTNAPTGHIRLAVLGGMADSERDLIRTRMAEGHSHAKCPIKGNVLRSGERIYHMPWQRDYARVRMDQVEGKRWFCDENEALAARWLKAAR